MSRQVTTTQTNFVCFLKTKTCYLEDVKAHYLEDVKSARGTASLLRQTRVATCMSIFHPKPHKTQEATSRRQTPLVRKFAYVDEADECGAEFLSLSKLRKHKKNTNHQKRRRKSGQVGGQTKKARGSAPLFQQYLQEHGLQHADHSDEEELDKINTGPAEGEEEDKTSRCGVCCKPEEDDEDGNNSWIECDNCLIWCHVLCIPAGHEVPNGDNNRDESDVPLYGECHVCS